MKLILFFSLSILMTISNLSAGDAKSQPKSPRHSRKGSGIKQVWPRSPRKLSASSPSKTFTIDVTDFAQEPGFPSWKFPSTAALIGIDAILQDDTDPNHLTVCCNVFTRHICVNAVTGAQDPHHETCSAFNSRGKIMIVSRHRPGTKFPLEKDIPGTQVKVALVDSKKLRFSRPTQPADAHSIEGAG